ncbi:MAG: hypothetical protein V4549_03545 [Bacteroidota bacterium]
MTVIDRSKTYFGEPQSEKFGQIITSGILETPDTTEVYVDDKDGEGLVRAAHGETVPTDDETGYKKGCEFLETDHADGSNPYYFNVGDESGCQFIQLNDSLGVNDDGVPMKNVLRVASAVVSAQTVTIGPDVYEIEIVNTDSTDDTANGDFNNITPTITVVGAVTRYSNTTFTPGALIRIQNEILRVTDVDGDDVTFRRGASGTTTATHADGQNIYVGDGIAGGSTVAVGLVTTLTPAVFTPALAYDINTAGSLSLLATSLQSGAEMLLESADEQGGTPIASGLSITCSETLAGSNNGWANTSTVSGKDAGARKVAVLSHTVLAVEVALNALRISLPFTPVGFIAQAYDASGLFKGTLTDNLTINSNRVEYDFAGSTNLVATDKVTVFAWN